MSVLCGCTRHDVVDLRFEPLVEQSYLRSQDPVTTGDNHRRPCASSQSHCDD